VKASLELGKKRCMREASKNSGETDREKKEVFGEKVEECVRDS
jgi:hypothetical protein